MPTFRWNSEHPYYRDGRLVKKVKTQQTINLTGTDCTILGWTAALLLGKLTLAPDFQTQSLSAELAFGRTREEGEMEYRRTEFTEWHDKEGRVRKRRLRNDRFYLSSWELNKVCSSLVRISDNAVRAIPRNHYLLK